MRDEIVAGDSCPTWLVETLTRTVRLDDGTRVLIRPLLYSDRAALVAGFHQLSPEARRLRFGSPPDQLSDRDLEYLTNIDYVNHFAWAAFDLDVDGTPGVAVGRYVRDGHDPSTAAVAVTVLDAYQQRGLGTMLVRMLAEVAAEHGIRTFVDYVHWDSPAVIARLSAEGARVSASEPGIARVEIDIPQPPVDEEAHHRFRAFLKTIRQLGAAAGMATR